MLCVEKASESIFPWHPCRNKSLLSQCFFSERFTDEYLDLVHKCGVKLACKDPLTLILGLDGRARGTFERISLTFPVAQTLTKDMKGSKYTAKGAFSHVPAVRVTRFYWGYFLLPFSFGQDPNPRKSTRLSKSFVEPQLCVCAFMCMPSILNKVLI